MSRRTPDEVVAAGRDIAVMGIEVVDVADSTFPTVDVHQESARMGSPAHAGACARPSQLSGLAWRDDAQ